MNGMDYLLKNLGFDPKEIEKKFGEAKIAMEQTFAYFKGRLDAQDESLHRIEGKMDRVLAMLEPEKEPLLLEEQKLNGRSTERPNAGL